jgi:hypothetical protein
MTKHNWVSELKKFAASKGFSQLRISCNGIHWPKVGEKHENDYREVGCTHTTCPDSSLHKALLKNVLRLMQFLFRGICGLPSLYAFASAR